MRIFLLLTVSIAVACCAELPRGQIVDEVKCAADPTETYALYLPSNYSSGRPWSVIFAFDPGARGRQPVERFQEAAEKYGYIVAGSRNSRNGPWDVSLSAARAMAEDLRKRFSIDSRRLYTAGLSGGARVALEVALTGKIAGKIAGVIASSAAFPDADAPKAVPFAIFGTAGTDDFNYLEMHELDRHLTSAHRVVIFEGGHEWLPKGLAMEALEWMEVQAMKSGLRARDQALWDRVLHQKNATEDEKSERAEEQRERRMRMELDQLLVGLDRDSPESAASLTQLQVRLTALAQQASAREDTAGRRMARRLLSGTIVESRGIDDPEYQKLLEKVRPANSPPR